MKKTVPEKPRLEAQNWPVHVIEIAAAQTANKAARLQPHWASVSVPLAQAQSRLEQLLKMHPQALYSKLGRHALRPFGERTVVLLALSAALEDGEQDGQVHFLVLSSLPFTGSRATTEGVTWGHLLAWPVATPEGAAQRLKWNATGKLMPTATRPLSGLVES